MTVMSAQPPLPMAPVAAAVSIGEAVALVEDGDGGRVFLRGELVYAWSVEDVPLRRLAAVQLVANKAARVADVAAAFGVDAGTLWRWGQQLSATGVAGLVPDKRGPKGAHRLTPEMVADIIARRAAGASYRAVAAAVGVSYTSVRRVSKPATATRAPAADDDSEHDDEHDTGSDSGAAQTTDDADPQDSGHGVIICACSGPGFDLVAQDEIGAGVAGLSGGEVLTQLRNGCCGAPGG